MADISASLVQSYGLKTGSDVVHSYSSAPVVQGPVLQYYGDAPVLVSGVDQRWRDMAALSCSVVHDWSSLSVTDTALLQSWALIDSAVQSEAIQAWDLLARDNLRGAIQQIWWGDFDPTVVTQPSVSCLVYESPGPNDYLNDIGELLGSLSSVIGVSLELSIDQYAISATLQLATLDDYLLCEPGRLVTLTGLDPGGDIVMRVDGRSRNRSGESTDTYSIELLSPAAWLDSPYASTVDGEFVGMASTIAAQVTSGKLSVSWETVDWYIGAGVFAVESQTPLSIIRSLAAAVGAVIQSSRDGGIRVISRYSVPVSSWESSTGVPIDEATTIISCSDTFEYNPGYNRFRISDDEGTSGLSDIRVSVEDTSDFVKTVKVQIPSLEALTLTHTGGPWVVVEPLGRTMVSVETPEYVEIVQGEGRTANTIVSIDASTWKQVDLGAVGFEASGLITSAVSGESLLELDYSYEEQVWRISSPTPEKVQFILEIANG